MTHKKDEPAIRSYFYYKGDWLYNLQDICKETSLRNISSAHDYWNNAVLTCQNVKYGSKLLYFKAIFLALSALSILLGTVVFLPILLVVFVSIVVFIWLIYNMIAVEMNLLEQLFLKFHGLFILCRHCNRKIALPVYKCPNCGAEHQRLLPTTKYGAFYRICSQCGEYIPTSRFFGRNSLPAICPFEDCRQPLNSEDAVPVTIAIIGGPSVGKSFIQMDMTVLMIKTLLSRIGWQHKIASEDESRISLLIENFDKGIQPASTIDQMVKALCMDVKSPKWAFPKRLYLYDPPGESFLNTKKLAGYNYYQHLRSAIFVIDPFAIDMVAKEFHDKLTSNSSIRISGMSPDESLERWLISMEKDHNGIAKNAVCAVVINKTDAFDFEKLTGLKTGASDEDCRRFLEKYECSNLMGQIEHSFKKCRFFAISAIGRNQTGSFSPEGLDEVITWLLQSAED